MLIIHYYRSCKYLQVPARLLQRYTDVDLPTSCTWDPVNINNVHVVGGVVCMCISGITCTNTSVLLIMFVYNFNS